MSYKATIEVGDKRITFEGPREFVEEQVKKYSSIVDIPSKHTYQQADKTDSAPHCNSERDLVREKQPRGHSEIVAVLAFWFTENGKPEFTEEDMRRAYIRAGVKPPKVVSQALRDAGNRYDYIEPGSERGTYSLTSHGDRTVRFDLPRPQ